MIWKNEKNNLDEMQDRKLLQIEKDCFWLLDFMLAAVVVIQILMGRKKSEMLGELICLIVVNMVMVTACIRNGIWDRHLKADAKTNMKVSAFAAIAVAVINLVFYFSNSYEHYGWGQLAAVLTVPALFTYIATFILVSLCGALAAKKARKLEEEQEEWEDD